MIHHKTFMAMAQVLASESHCRSYQVAAIAVKNQNIVSIGINGTLPGQLNCDDIMPEKPDSWDVAAMAKWREAHRAYSKVHEIHAEQNMVARAGQSLAGATVYVTHQPCQDCAKLMAAAGVVQIIYGEKYDSAGDYSFLTGTGITIEAIENTAQVPGKVLCENCAVRDFTCIEMQMTGTDAQECCAYVGPGKANQLHDLQEENRRLKEHIEELKKPVITLERGCHNCKHDRGDECATENECTAPDLTAWEPA